MKTIGMDESVGSSAHNIYTVEHLKRLVIHCQGRFPDESIIECRSSRSIKKAENVFTERRRDEKKRNLLITDSSFFVI